MTAASDPATVGKAGVRYHKVAIWLHWVIAFSIVGLAVVGSRMADAPEEIRFQLYQMHKTFGVLVLLLTIARIVWRLMNPPPPEPPMPGWQGFCARATHILFYGLMLAIPLSGWAMVSASPTGVPTLLFNAIPWPHLPFWSGMEADALKPIEKSLISVHGALAFMTLGLMLIHIAAALKHQFVDKDQLLARMAPGFFGTAEPVTPQGKGLGATFAAPIAFAAAVILGGAALVGASRSSAGSALDRAVPSVAGAWTIDYEASQLSFGGVHDGRDYSGAAETWTGVIVFDPDAVQDAAVTVEVDTATIRTGDAFYDASIREADWMNIARFPTLTFASTRFEQTAEGYTAFGDLTLRGETRPVSFPFTLTMTDDQAIMEGELVLSRLDWGIGVASDPTADWVADDITLSFNVVASR